MISLRFFARTGHIDAFRSIVGEARGGEKTSVAEKFSRAGHWSQYEGAGQIDPRGRSATSPSRPVAMSHYGLGGTFRNGVCLHGRPLLRSRRSDHRRPSAPAPSSLLVRQRVRSASRREWRAFNEARRAPDRFVSAVRPALFRSPRRRRRTKGRPPRALRWSRWPLGRMEAQRLDVSGSIVIPRLARSSQI